MSKMKKKYTPVTKPAGFLKKTKKAIGVTLAKSAAGKYVVYTHRARSKEYSSPEKIPTSVIEFIESTG